IGRADTVCSDLRPPARRRAEIDDPLSRREQAEAVIDLDQLVGGAGAIAFGAGAGDVRVVQLPLEPAGGGGGAAPGGLDADLQPALARAAVRHFDGPGYAFSTLRSHFQAPGRASGAPRSLVRVPGRASGAPRSLVRVPGRASGAPRSLVR